MRSRLVITLLLLLALMGGPGATFAQESSPGEPARDVTLTEPLPATTGTTGEEDLPDTGVDPAVAPADQTTEQPDAASDEEAANEDPADGSADPVSDETTEEPAAPTDPAANDTTGQSADVQLADEEIELAAIAVSLSDLACDGTATLSWTGGHAGNGSFALLAVLDGVYYSWIPYVFQNSIDGSIVLQGPAYSDLAGPDNTGNLRIEVNYAPGGPNPTPEFVTSARVAGCAHDQPAESAEISNLTCDGTGTFSYANFPEGGRFAINILIDGANIAWREIGAASGTGSVNFSFPSYAALQWDDDGAGTYKLNVYHVTASGQQSDLLISSQAGSCTDEEEPGDTLSLEVVCPGAAFVNHNWPAIEPNVVFIAYVNGVEVDRVSATKSDIGLVDYYFDEADLPGSGLYAIRVEIGFGTLDNPTIVSGQTIEGCGEEPEPSVFVRNLSCDGTGVLHWANLPEDTALLITGEIDGAPTRNFTYYPFEPTGSDDFELSLRFDDFSLSIEIGDPGPVISITVRNAETNEVYTTASAPCAAGASAWQLSGIDCDGTATLTWTDLPETMAFSVYPALMPAPAPGTILSGETGTAGPGSGSHTISIDLSEYRFMDFSLVVTAGPVEDEQVQVANDFVMDCGLVWVDPDPDGGETPASGENPGAGSAANQPNGSVTPIVTALPDTGAGSAAAGAFGWSAMLMLAALALAFAVTGGRLRWSAHQGR